MNNELTRSKVSIYHLCFIALAICINVAGGQIALFLHLPIYFDSIGTVFVGAVLGPVYGMLPNVLSGIIMGCTTDIFSLYYAPVGIILGLMTGLVYKRKNDKPWWIFLAALAITLPSTLVSASITANLFGGITSSGSTVLVQLFNKTLGMNLTLSCFIVQFLTDYLDRIVALFVVNRLIQILPQHFFSRLK